MAELGGLVLRWSRMLYLRLQGVEFGFQEIDSPLLVFPGMVAGLYEISRENERLFVYVRLF